MMTFLRAAGLAAIVAAAAVAPALAQDEPQPRPVIEVTGEGRVQAAPDLALITLGVVTEAASAREALSGNTASLSRILAALKGDGLEPRDLQTSGFSVDPVYSQPPRDYDPAQPFTPAIVGYRVSNNLTIRIRDLSRVGTLLDKVVGLGANSISGPSFTVADPKPLQDEARRAAMADAIAKAGLYADAATVRLGSIQRIAETGGMAPPQPLAAGAMMRMEAQDSAVPIEGGEVTMEAQVTVSWALED